MMRIGDLVKEHIGTIFNYCESDPTELIRLMSAEYSRRTFGLAWPFCIDADKISIKDNPRYWTDHYVLGDRRLRVCSQWYERQRVGFSNYLAGKKIAVMAGAEPVRQPRPRPVPSHRNSRHGSIQIGDAQNAFIRVILSRLGEESFTDRDWQETVGHFGNRCAYCDEGEAEHMDHGVPINRTKLGEHRLGNIIPACKKCNSEKHQRDYREHLREDLERINRIEAYMASKGYVPLGEHDQVKRILEQAHKEVAALADRYIDILNMVLPPSPAAST